VEEEVELWRLHVEWRRKGHDVMGKLKDVTEEVIRTAPINSRIRKLARVELKTLQRLMECEERAEKREWMQREEAANPVMWAEAEGQWAAALQSREDIPAGGRLPPQSTVGATEGVAASEPRASAECTPRQQIKRMLQKAEQEAADAEEPEEEPVDAVSQDAEDPQEEQDADPAAQVQLEQLQQDMRNAAMLEMVTVGLREMQDQLGQRSEWAVRRERAAQATADAEQAAAGADAEQAAEVERMYSEILQNTQDTGSGRQQQMAEAQMTQQAGYYGPQPGQSTVRATAEGNRRQRAPPQAAAERVGSSSSSKQVKARQNITGVDTGGNRVAKSRRTSELSVERLELGNVLVGAALQQAERWVQQWDRLVGRSSSRHLRVSTPARSSEEKWRQGVWARQQLMSNDHTTRSRMGRADYTAVWQPDSAGSLGPADTT
jgi:hypothetical protein